MSFSDLLKDTTYQAAINAGIDPMPTNTRSDSYARKTRAWLARQEWADYQQRFQPVEQELIDSVMTPEMLDQRLAAIKVNSGAASDASAKVEQMMLQRYGVRPSAQQRQASDTTRQIAATAGQIGAENNTRTHIYDRNMAALSGSGVARGDINSSLQGG